MYNIPKSVTRLLALGRVYLFDNLAGQRKLSPIAILALRTNPGSRKERQMRVVSYTLYSEAPTRYDETTDSGLPYVRRKPSRSKYAPHIGKKQQLKLA